MKKALLWLWQAPQHLLAMVIRKILYMADKVVFEADHHGTIFIGVDVLMGLSLGNYIFIHRAYGEKVKNHELGHSVQSRRLGPLYLLIIGLPSLIGNIYDRKYKKGSAWYYKQPWEAWADRLGGVVRP